MGSHPAEKREDKGDFKGISSAWYVSTSAIGKFSKRPPEQYSLKHRVMKRLTVVVCVVPSRPFTPDSFRDLRPPLSAVLDLASSPLPSPGTASIPSIQMASSW